MAICISNGNRLNTSILMLPAGMKMNISMKSSDREERGGGPDGFISTPFGDGSLMRMLGWVVYQMEQEEPVSLRDRIAVEPHRLLSLPGRPLLITCSFHCKGAQEGEGGVLYFGVFL